MLEAAIDEKANAVGRVCSEIDTVHKSNRALERKLGKLHVKRTKRGSSREVLQQLQQQIEAQQRRNDKLLDNFRTRLSAKQTRVHEYRQLAEEFRKQMNTQQGQRPQMSYDEAITENATLKRRLQQLDQ